MGARRLLERKLLAYDRTQRLVLEPGANARVQALASSSGEALSKCIPMMLASRPMVSRGLISTVPRLPMTTTRPPRARRARSLPRLTFASISSTRSTTATLRELENLAQIAVRVVVDDVMRAFTGDEVASFRRAPGSDHRHAMRAS